MGTSFWKKLRCGHRKILRLTTPLTIYRVGLPGNNAHKSTQKHRFWTKKHRKYPEITQKITPNLFGTLDLNVQCNVSPKNAESLEIGGVQGFSISRKSTRTCLFFSFWPHVWPLIKTQFSRLGISICLCLKKQIPFLCLLRIKFWVLQSHLPLKNIA